MEASKIVDTLSDEDIVLHLKKTFSTNSGQIILAYLVSRYVENSCLTDCVNKTHYLLGQKELVQTLVKEQEEGFGVEKTEIITGSV